MFLILDEAKIWDRQVFCKQEKLTKSKKNLLKKR